MDSKARRVKHKVMDAFEGNDDADKSLMEEVNAEARLINAGREFHEKRKLKENRKALALESKSSPDAKASHLSSEEDFSQEDVDALMEKYDGDVDGLLRALNLSGDDSEGDDEDEDDVNAEGEDALGEEDIQELMRQMSDDESTSNEEPEAFSPPPEFRASLSRFEGTSSTSKGDVLPELLRALDAGNVDDDSITSLTTTPAVDTDSVEDDMYSDESIDRLWAMVEFGILVRNSLSLGPSPNSVIIPQDGPQNLTTPCTIANGRIKTLVH